MSKGNSSFKKIALEKSELKIKISKYKLNRKKPGAEMYPHPGFFQN